MKFNQLWLVKNILEYVESTVHLENQFLLEENRILKKRLKENLVLSNEEKISLAEIGRKLGIKKLGEICTLFKPRSIMNWYYKLIRDAHTYPHDSKRGVGRPSTMGDIEIELIKIAKQNRRWGYGKLQGALHDIGFKYVSKDTVKRLLKKHGIPPKKDRMDYSSWHEFIRTHMDVLFATDFFTIDIVDISRGLKVRTYFVLFFIHLETRKVHVAGMTENPDSEWMKRMAKNVTAFDDGFLKDGKYLIHDRDTNFMKSGFRDVLKNSGVKCIATSRKSPDLNAYAERWIESIRDECLNHVMIFREKSLRYTIKQYIEFYNHERNHQSLDNELIDPQVCLPTSGRIKCKKRLGGLLKFYRRKAS